MPVTLLGHAFQSAVADGSRGEQIQPQRDWNDEHAFTGGTHGSILLRNTGSTKPGASWLASVASGQVLVSQGAGSLPAWSPTPTVTSMTTPLVVGGALNTSTLTLKSTTANGLAGSDIIFQVGNNGATEAMRVLETGLVSFNASAQVAANLIPAIKSGTAVMSFRVSDDSAFATISANNVIVNGTTGIQLVQGAANIFWQNRSTIFSPGDGILEFTNFAGTDFSRLQFGGTTASFPALKRSGTSLQVRLADDSADGGLTTGTLTVNTTATITTSTTTPIVIGGTTTTSTLTFKPTSGAGTTNADMIFANGTNGGTEVMRITNAGLLTFGGTGAGVSALKSQGVTNLQVRLGDDSGYADVNARSYISNAANTGLQIQSGAQIFWTSRALLVSPADAKIKLSNNALTAGVTLDATTADTLKVQVFAANAYGTVDALAYKLSGTAFQQVQSAPGDPTGTASAVGVMMGLAVAFTPSSTRILIIISGNIASNTGGDGAAAQIATGTGGAPGNGVAATGTTRGNLATLTNDATGTNKFPFTCSAVVTGLSAGVALWIDLNLRAITAGTANVFGLSVQVCDLP